MDEPEKLECHKCEGDFKGDPYTGKLVCKCGHTEVDSVVYIHSTYEPKPMTQESLDKLHKDLDRIMYKMYPNVTHRG